MAAVMIAPFDIRRGPLWRDDQRGLWDGGREVLSGVFLFLASFLASAVEGVEALTIVLAVGVSRGWRATLVGVAAGGAAPAAVVLVLGPALPGVPLRAPPGVVRRLLAGLRLPWPAP